MSSAASWSYTASITIWSKNPQNWDDAVTWSPPIVFKGDYSATSERLVSSAGIDFVAKQNIFTEYADAKVGDMVLIGSSTNPDPHSVNAQEILLILDYGDTLSRQAPDYRIVT
jgi:hypothetical protein